MFVTVVVTVTSWSSTFAIDGAQFARVLNLIYTLTTA